MPARPVADRPRPRARRNQRLSEPVVRGAGAEIIAGADDQHAGVPRGGGVLQPALQHHADRALARRRLLGRRLADRPGNVGGIVIDSARQDDARARLARCGQAVVEHRQHQPVPVAITRRIDRMDDQRRAPCGGAHRARVHRVACDRLACRRQRPGPPRQRADAPPAGAQPPQHRAADPAGRAQDQCRPFRRRWFRHRRLHPFDGEADAVRPAQRKLPKWEYRLYVFR